MQQTHFSGFDELRKLIRVLGHESGDLEAVIDTVFCLSKILPYRDSIIFASEANYSAKHPFVIFSLEFGEGFLRRRNYNQ